MIFDKITNYKEHKILDMPLILDGVQHVENYFYKCGLLNL